MPKHLVRVMMAVAVTLTSVFVVGCESDAQTGALIGSLAGAGVGQLAGGDTKGTLIGAGAGAGVGYLVGNESDKRKAQAESARVDAATVTVNVTNSNGSIISVKLRKQGVGYVGPRGEFYQNLPTEEQLKPVYGF